MPGPNRIDIGGILCTCVGHAVLLGGFLLSSASPPPRATPGQAVEPTLLIELIPLDRLAESYADAGPPVPPRAMLMDSAENILEPDNSPRPGPAPGQVADQTPDNGDVLPVENTPSALSAAALSELTEYQRRLYETVARHSYYPAEALDQQPSGVTTLAFRLDRLGYVLESRVQKSSGSDLLDDAALQALARAEPLPPIPPSLPANMDFVVEIDSSALPQMASQTGY